MKIAMYFIIFLCGCYGTLSAQEQQGSAGFDHGFYIRSADGSFIFRPFGLIHTDLRINNNGKQINSDYTQASTFLVRRLRLGFEGQLYNWIDYDLETNVGAGGAELIFAWMNLGYYKNAQVRIGQFKEPFSYEVLLPEKYLDFIERSIVATVISPAEDIGVMVHNFGSPLGNFFEYGVGMFNGLGATNEKTDPEKSFEYVGRIALYPFAHYPHEWLKNLRVAGYTLFEDNRTEGVEIRPRTPLGFEFFPRIPTKGRRHALGGDIQFMYGPFSAKAEYIRNDEDVSDFANVEVVTSGWNIDVTYLFTGEEKKRAMDSGYEVSARIEQLRVDAGSLITLDGYTDTEGNPVVLRENDVTTMTVGLNKYLNYNLKLQFNYQIDLFGDEMFTPTSREGDVLESASTTRHKLLTRIQLYF